jgi:hypothetical protein
VTVVPLLPVGCGLLLDAAVEPGGGDGDACRWLTFGRQLGQRVGLLVSGDASVSGYPVYRYLYHVGSEGERRVANLGGDFLPGAMGGWLFLGVVLGGGGGASEPAEGARWSVFPALNPSLSSTFPSLPSKVEVDPSSGRSTRLWYAFPAGLGRGARSWRCFGGILRGGVSQNA